jgi:hypothetical protein
VPTLPVHRPGGLPVDLDALADLLPELPVGVARYLGAGAFEPTLGRDKTGALFYSAYNYENTEDGDVFISLDHGHTWKEVTPAIAGEQFPPMSFDNYVYVDVDTGRVYSVDLFALLCSTLSYTDDQARSWITNPIGCGHPVGVHDHQTVWTSKPRQTPTIGYSKLVHYCVNRIVDTACAKSIDGGLTFGPLRPLVFHEVGPAPPRQPCGGLTAHGTDAPDGTIYLPKGDCGVPVVAISQDDGHSWRVSVISADVRVRGHEVAFAVDEAGNAYAFWIGEDLKPYLAASADGGWTWNPAVMVAPPEVGTADFPTLAAGSDGRVVAAYYGTAAEKSYSSMRPDDVWHGYLTVITDALSEAPHLATVTVNPVTDPLARGGCGGSRCDGVGDFIDVIIDHEGRPWAAFVDVCNKACAEVDGTTNVGVEGLVGTLAAGPALRGALAPLPPLP